MAARKAWTGQGRIGHHVAKEGGPLPALVAKHFRLEPARAAELIALGAVYHKGLRAGADAKVTAGDYLRVHLEPKRFPAASIDWAKTIIAEEKEFLVVDKPYGIPVHATLDNAEENTLAALRRLTGKTLLVTQRLDVPVGGLLVFARTEGFQRRFNRWLGERKVHKRYLALSSVAPTTGLKVHFMEPSERSPRRVVNDERPGWQRCELTIHAVRPVTLGNASLHEVEVELHTGRTHQIRAQLAALGSPLTGDRLYGSKVPCPLGPPGQAIGLFSFQVGFPEPGAPPRRYEIAPKWA